MGCNSSQISTKVLMPQTTRDVAIETKLSPFLNPIHELNVNRKYTYLYTILPNEYVGSGLSRTNKYVSLVPIEALDQKRNEFWGFLKRVKGGRSKTMLGSLAYGMFTSRLRSFKQKRSLKL